MTDNKTYVAFGSESDAKLHSKDKQEINNQRFDTNAILANISAIEKDYFIFKTEISDLVIDIKRSLSNLEEREAIRARFGFDCDMNSILTWRHQHRLSDTEIDNKLKEMKNHAPSNRELFEHLDKVVSSFNDQLAKQNDSIYKLNNFINYIKEVEQIRRDFGNDANVDAIISQKNIGKTNPELIAIYSTKHKFEDIAREVEIMKESDKIRAQFGPLVDVSKVKMYKTLNKSDIEIIEILRRESPIDNMMDLKRKLEHLDSVSLNSRQMFHAKIESISEELNRLKAVEAARYTELINILEQSKNVNSDYISKVDKILKNNK